MYNLTVEDLSYKWQALSYSTTNTLAIFSLQSVPDLKARLQQELGKLNAAKQEAVARSAAGPAFGRGLGRAGGAVNVPAGSSLSGGFKIGSLPARSGIVKTEPSAFSGPTKVVFQGPKLDEQSRKSRACECPHVDLPQHVC